MPRAPWSSFFAYQEDNAICAGGKQIGGQLARKKCFDVVLHLFCKFPGFELRAPKNII